jgi:hypothetical protein
MFGPFSILQLNGASDRGCHNMDHAGTRKTWCGRVNLNVCERGFTNFEEGL